MVVLHQLHAQITAEERAAAIFDAFAEEGVKGGEMPGGRTKQGVDESEMIERGDLNEQVMMLRETNPVA